MKVEKVDARIAALYFGQMCTCAWIETGEASDVPISTITLSYLYYDVASIIPHLRSIESLTEEEAKELIEMVNGGPVVYGGNLFDLMRAEYSIMDEIIGTPHVWLHMLSKGFDLFGLIDSGLAKDIGNGKQ